VITFKEVLKFLRYYLNTIILPNCAPHKPISNQESTRCRIAWLLEVLHVMNCYNSTRNLFMISHRFQRTSWSWMYGSWINN